MRIIRTVILVTVVVLLLPSPPKQDSPGPQLASLDEPSGTDLLFAATRTASDLGTFCTRQPGVCETALYVAGMVEAKAKYSVKLIYEWANEASGEPTPNQAESGDEIITGSTRFADTGDTPSQNTLRASDRIPQWRAPDSSPANQS